MRSVERSDTFLHEPSQSSQKLFKFATLAPVLSHALMIKRNRMDKNRTLPFRRVNRTGTLRLDPGTFRPRAEALPSSLMLRHTARCAACSEADTAENFHLTERNPHARLSSRVQCFQPTKSTARSTVPHADAPCSSV